MPERVGIVNLTGKLPLVDVKSVIAESELCISSDSGLQHIAEAVGTRCLAIYSTTPPALRIGHYRHVKAIWRESLPCVPCFDRGCPAAPCMHIAPDLVMRAVEDWDSLGLSTNVEEIAKVKRAATWIEIAAENQIMESWPMAAMG
jgi:ADP-heptose:LPS heptosyltransferase